MKALQFLLIRLNSLSEIKKINTKSLEFFELKISAYNFFLITIHLIHNKI